MKTADVQTICETISRAAATAVREAIRANTPPRLTGQPHEVLTREQAARMLRCTPRHVGDLLDEGRIEGIDIASPGSSRRVIRIKATSIQALLNGAESGVAHG